MQPQKGGQGTEAACYVATWLQEFLLGSHHSMAQQDSSGRHMATYNRMLVGDGLPVVSLKCLVQKQGC